jgi:hypothetical protein
MPHIITMPFVPHRTLGRWYHCGDGVVGGGGGGTLCERDGVGFDRGGARCAGFAGLTCTEGFM